ncbi:MAG: MFS transporter, partial [bacterium]
MFQLLASKRFGPFFLTQSLGAFNDNVYKNSLAILIAFQSGDLLAGQADQLINLSAFLFIFPFFLFSATAGQLADKFERSHLIRLIKLLEIVIMIMASIGFYLNSLTILLSTLFLMGSQSTFFGPIKYSIIPQHLNQEELVAGNALVETGTFLSILIGTLLAAMLMTLGDQSITAVTATILATASLGYLASWKIPHAPAPCPNLKINLNPFTETLSNFRFIRQDQTILNSVVGISWFWFFGFFKTHFEIVFPNQLTPCKKWQKVAKSILLGCLDET